MNASPHTPAAGPPPSSPDRVSDERVAAVLADVATIGPWFAVATPAASGTVRWDALYAAPVAGGPTRSAGGSTRSPPHSAGTGGSGRRSR